MKTLLLCIWHPFRHCKNSKGVTSLEVALTMLPFLLAVAGIAEFGYYYLQQHTLQSAVRQGIRVALLGATLQDGDGNAMSREDSIIQAIQDKTGGVVHLDADDISIYPVSDDFSDPDNVENLDPDAGAAGAFMRVRVEYDHQFLTPLIGGLFSDEHQIHMEAVGTFRNEDFILE